MRTHPAGGECAALEATPKQNELVQEDTTLEKGLRIPLVRLPY